MNQIRSPLFVIIGIISCFVLQTKSADEYTDKNRPYEFGFTIDGEQHRHEKKDKNGIIQGEFGFITADGVYHVTVYATDEQGRFKIISMKNIRVKPYPTTQTRQGHSLSLASSPSTSPQSTPNAIAPSKTLVPSQEKSPITPEAPQIQLKPVPAASPAKSCSHCSIPTTTTPAPPPAPPAYNSQQAVGAPGEVPQNQLNSFSPSYSAAQQPNAPNNIGDQPKLITPNQQNNINTVQQAVSSGPQSPQNYPEPSQNYPGQQNIGQSSPTGFSQINPEQEYSTNPVQGNNPSQINNFGQYGGSSDINRNTQTEAKPDNNLNYPQTYPQGETGTPLYTNQISPSSDSLTNPKQNGQRIPKQFNPNEQAGFPGLEEAVKAQSPNENQYPLTEPKLVAAQMSIVDKNTDINTKRPGEQDGLPKGLEKSDVEQLLYTFNYTLAFQGHFEEGYRNGVKQGYYFVTGRNGVRTRVDYVADDKGFHPKISQETLDVTSDDVPKPETEKDAKYGLKGYEFKWLYYPVGS